MNLGDLEAFFSKDIFVQDPNNSWAEKLDILKNTINECRNNEETKNIEFPNTDSPALITLLNGIFIRDSGNAKFSYLDFSSFKQGLRAISYAKETSSKEEQVKNDILNKICLLSREWATVKAKYISEKIFELINNYTGAAYQYLSGSSSPQTLEDVIQQIVENAYFLAVWNWMGWMQNNWTTVFVKNTPPAPQADIIDLNTNQGTYKLPDIQKDITLLNEALPQKIFDPTKCCVTSQIPNNNTLNCYTVHDLQSYLGAILAIGGNKATNDTAYVIRILDNDAWNQANNFQTQIDFAANKGPSTDKNFPNGVLADSATYVFLSKNGHYAYPFRIYGHHVVDLWKSKSNKLPYRDAYKNIMSFADKSLESAAVQNFVTSGNFPQTVPELGDHYADGKNSVMDGALNTITVLAANYIAECDRNQAQLLLGLLLFSRGKTTWSKYTSTGSPDFPMQGGAWKSEWSWGNDVNPNIEKGGDAQVLGQGTRRWFLNIFFANNGGGFLGTNTELVKSNITNSILSGKRNFTGSLHNITPPDLDQIFKNCVREQFRIAINNFLGIF